MMMNDRNRFPSPGPRDDAKVTPMALLTTSGKDLADPKTTLSLKPKSLGHQGDRNTGGINKYMKVLYLTGLDDSLNYKDVYECFTRFGDIERIKLVYLESDYDCYITFKYHTDALAAQNSVDSGTLNFSGKSKILSESNVKDDACDFVPEKCCSLDNITIRRNPPLPIWHVVSYKPGKENRYRAAQELQSQIGTIPRKNIKNYGRSILIKAENRTQANLLKKYCLSVLKQYTG